MAIVKSEEREKQQDSSDHMVGVHGNTVCRWGNAGVHVKETASPALSSIALFEGRWRPTR